LSSVRAAALTTTAHDGCWLKGDYHEPTLRSMLLRPVPGKHSDIERSGTFRNVPERFDPST
jgi:hypothetical protein